jgi:hypothetical protein
MFGFLRKQAPRPCKTNPGTGVAAKIASANAGGSWMEEVNVIESMAQVLADRGEAVIRRKNWLEHRESRFDLSPRLVSIQPIHPRGARTVTTIQINHPLLTPDGVFEYQHSTGNSVDEAIRKGFDQWTQTDFVVLLDALRDKPKICTYLEMSLPAKNGRPARFRRAVLGPVMHVKAKPSPPEVEIASAASPNEAESVNDEHPFCPCCLLTRSMKTFQRIVDESGIFGLRFFAARDAEGTSQADCRVNGDDWVAGAEALREYVRTWPGAGVEFRKQFVVLQSVAKPTRPHT